MTDCIFCRIMSGEISSYKIWEDEEFVAILDAFPNIKGQSLVISKKHIDSYLFALSEARVAEIMKAAKKVANLLEKKLAVKRVHMISEGTGVNHLHIKLYPAMGYGKGPNPPGYTPEKFEKYPGYVTSAVGPRADEEELKAVWKEITS
ncbi:MAG: HIT domain-containing protein [Candidatus Micrarchaeota archaeon]|nr:HIT domain-containing protein [Candidatus Micrarchaeota archaeon]